MKSYWMQTGAGDATFELRDIAVPEPGPQQLLVRVRAAGLNRGEFLPGLHGKPGAAKAAGIEGAGEIVKLGDSVAGFQVGQRVMGRFPAAFAEYAVIDLREAIPVPDNLSWNEAASIPLAFMVVYDMLGVQGRLTSEEWLLVTGVSSGVGVAALQTAKVLGAKVIGTSGSADKLERLQEHGLDLGVCTRAGDFHQAVMQATDGKGADLVVNAVGGSLFTECVRSMAFQGRFATVGYVDGVMKAEIDIEALHSKRLHLFGVSNRLRRPEQRAEPVMGFIANVLPAIANGCMRPIIDRVFAFDQLVAAKAHMESNLHLGKIVLAGA